MGEEETGIVEGARKMKEGGSAVEDKRRSWEMRKVRKSETGESRESCERTARL